MIQSAMTEAIPIKRNQQSTLSSSLDLLRPPAQFSAHPLMPQLMAREASSASLGIFNTPLHTPNPSPDAAFRIQDCLFPLSPPNWPSAKPSAPGLRAQSFNTPAYNAMESNDLFPLLDASSLADGGDRANSMIFHMPLQNSNLSSHVIPKHAKKCGTESQIDNCSGNAMETNNTLPEAISFHQKPSMPDYQFTFSQDYDDSRAYFPSTSQLQYSSAAMTENWLYDSMLDPLGGFVDMAYPSMVMPPELATFQFPLQVPSASSATVSLCSTPVPPSSAVLSSPPPLDTAQIDSQQQMESLTLPSASSKRSLSCPNTSTRLPVRSVRLAVTTPTPESTPLLTSKNGRKSEQHSRASSPDDHEPGYSYKNNKRFRLPKEQMAWLKELFDQNPLPSSAEAERIAAEIGVDVQKIKIFFQNRRAAEKRRAASRKSSTA
ncbi:hypothetical protein BCR33DRAFT_314974 [Rhizoclosmatium globosum]|uniref:Homeobox domain-containing protein n=1 Tax=Rhizoclosmatium globosum TaxID=329046 RepID=A0A1Y2CZK2_9FUNG|nr:hypothetical protein BCR33DRAFT_314974 [Rhizoclosmatium globosum]|eukprot:ORY52306.1 hypothetical protein BCR33DRAFT_314974 [Rhizoclosmatium globosum]